MTPILQTARLTLTGHRPEDLDALAAIWSDPAVYRHIGGRARGREEVWLRLLRHVGQWAVFGHGMWVLRDRDTNAVLGEAGLMDSRRAIVPPLADVPETGWTLAAAAHGRGLAREAMTAVLDWADAQGRDATTCIIDPANAPSIRLAERLGYAVAGERSYDGRPVIAMTRGGVTG